MKPGIDNTQVPSFHLNIFYVYNDIRKVIIFEITKVEIKGDKLRIDKGRNYVWPKS